MECFYHKGIGAVGLCTRCQKACCHTCFTQIAGQLLCPICTQQAQDELQRNVTRMKSNAKLAIIIAYIALACGAIYSLCMFFFAKQNNNLVFFLVPISAGSVLPSLPQFLRLPLILVPLLALVNAYSAWSLYWAFALKSRLFQPRQGRETNNGGRIIIYSHKDEFGTSLALLLIPLITYIIPISLAICCSFLGGSIYEFFRAQRVAKGHIVDDIYAWTKTF